jgi:hypothetical protein
MTYRAVGDEAKAAGDERKVRELTPANGADEEGGGNRIALHRLGARHPEAR